MTEKTTLIFVEDPGAANFIAHLPQALAGENKVVLLAGGTAQNYLTEQKLDVMPLSEVSDLRALVALLSPSLIVCGTSTNPDSPGLELIRLGRERSTCTVAVVDLEVNAQYRFAGNTDNPLACAPEWLIVPDQSCAVAFEKLGYRKDRIFVSGFPKIDQIAAARNHLQDVDRNALRQEMFGSEPKAGMLIAFLCEPSTGFDPQMYRRSSAYTLSGFSDSDLRTDIVLEELLAALESIKTKKQVVLRLHPKNSVEEFAAFEGRISSFSQGGDPLKFLWCCDAIVGMSSMMLQEAWLLGKPVLSILPRIEEKEWLPALKHGFVECATTRESVQDRVRKLLKSPKSFVSEAKTAPFQTGASTGIADFLKNILITSAAENC